MEATPKQSFTIHHVQPEDVSTLAQLSADAFETDRQTVMKGLGKEPFDMKAETLRSLPHMLRSPKKCVVLKAVDAVSGEIIGYCNWGFRGLEPDEMPVLEGGGDALARIPPPTDSDDKPSLSRPPEPEADPIRRLEALTNADMNAWMAEMMPEGTRCFYVIGLSVKPKHQGRGVGSALLRWGTRACDERGVFAWVHSSEPAWRMYEKSGFQTIRSLDVDLDEYAPMPPPNEGPGAKWGHYVFRYMKYLPRKDKTSGGGSAVRTG
ncbi:acetyltransferase (GNAT) family protein [Hirsutella rhossiliensis]|uniref:Acetyltransferase (GNAT) family domain-containing protein n=1 Tax=Hirsutella rhossiliensis TaxID=111463 RepID=A0A9P8MMH1_9HYPO|nr:acetyltransferase (GNAT) family domain-containing protein [Hirsutella rhossiliensis]KAH0958022.1 acetyltransferase (GNAT) family domain-containing protein [Hirsutella rhossiliensis]